MGQWMKEGGYDGDYLPEKGRGGLGSVDFVDMGLETQKSTNLE